MIPRRHAWLLRDTQTCFDDDHGYGHACRVCSATERGLVRLRRHALERHLADHRREKLTDDTAPTLTVAGATMEEGE